MDVLVRLVVGVYLLSAGFGMVNDFELMRWVVFAGVGFLLLFLLTVEIIGPRFKVLFAVLFSGILYLFNPFDPVYLYDYTLWRVIDFTAAGILIGKPILIDRFGSEYIEDQEMKKKQLEKERKDPDKRSVHDVYRIQERDAEKEIRKARAEFGVSGKGKPKKPKRKKAAVRQKPVKETKEPVSPVAKEPDLQEVADLLKTSNDFVQNVEQIYAYAASHVSKKDRKTIERIKELDAASEKAFWELIQEANETGQILYGGGDDSIRALLDKKLIAFDDKYPGNERLIKLLPESSDVFQHLKPFRP